MDKARRRPSGLTLLELVLASALLVAAAIPIVNASGRAVNIAQDIERRTQATFLAQGEMENAMALAAENFGLDLSKNSANLGNGYLATVQQTTVGLKKTVTVKVGYDKAGDGVLSSSEVLVSFVTIIADKGN